MIKPGLLSASVTGATNDIFAALLDVSELRFIALQVAGTFSLTLIVEASNDEGTSPSLWTAIGVVPATGGSVASSITAPGIYLAPLGYKYLRVRCSAFTSGPATVAVVFSRDAVGTLQTGSGSGGAGDASEATLQSILAAVDMLEANTTGLATQAGQADIVTAIENIVVPPPVGGALEATQSKVLSTFITMKELLKAIVNPPWLDKTLNRLRQTAIVESGTITTVTTVTTVSTVSSLSNMVNVDGYQGKLLVINQNNAAWAALVRSTIS